MIRNVTMQVSKTEVKLAKELLSFAEEHGWDLTNELIKTIANEQDELTYDLEIHTKTKLVYGEAE